MNYLNRACMAASVVVVKGLTDQCSKYNSTSRVLGGKNKRNSAGCGKGGEKGNQVEESMEKVMFLNCWAQS